MDDKTINLLMEVAGLLTLIAKGIPVPNLPQQADDLLTKISDAVAGE